MSEAKTYEIKTTSANGNSARTTVHTDNIRRHVKAAIDNGSTVNSVTEK